MERFDAIVVGAGPAGSTAAYRLAAGGARTLLVDRARFPRDKPCGGGLTLRAARALPFAVDAVVEHVVDRLELRTIDGAAVERTGRGPLVLMTQRRRLDAFLAARAADAGADFRDGVRAGAVSVAPEGVEVTLDGARVGAAALVGADGANGVVARALGVDGGYTRGVALEANAPYDARFRGRAVVELGTVAGGYGWVFPKGDHVNVGVGGWRSDGPVLRERLLELCDRLAVPRGDLRDLRGHRLPLRPRGARAAAGRALLVGDAAGLVDPASGVGMYEAFVSARLAAESILDLLAGRAASLDAYPLRLRAALDPLTVVSWGVKRFAERWPRATVALVRRDLVWRGVEGLVTGDLVPPARSLDLLAPALW